MDLLDQLDNRAKLAIQTALKAKQDELVEKWNAIDKAVQTKYDAETGGGSKATEQADWKAKYKQFADAIMRDMGWTP